MEEERRLVWRVLRHWTEIAQGRPFPGRDEIEPWFLSEDGANRLLIAVESPIELSHFVVVGVNLAVALPYRHVGRSAPVMRPTGGFGALWPDDRGHSDASRSGYRLPRCAAPALGSRRRDRLSHLCARFRRVRSRTSGPAIKSMCRPARDRHRGRIGSRRDRSAVPIIARPGRPILVLPGRSPTLSFDSSNPRNLATLHFPYHPRYMVY